jgi:hypothetical protein
MCEFDNTDDTQDRLHEEPHRLTQSEFRIRQQQYKSDVIRTLWETGVLFVLGGFGFIVLFSFQLELHLQEYKRVMAGVALACLVVFSVWVVWWLCILEKRGPKCPTCQVPLVGIDACITMATRSCPKCYVVILQPNENCSDSESIPVERNFEPGLLTSDDLDQKVKASSRLLTQLTTITFLAALMLSGATAGVLWYLDLWSASLIPGIFLDGPPQRSTMGLLATICVFVITFGSGFIVTLRKSEACRSLTCWACGDRLSHYTLLKLTGNCTSCGAQIIQDAALADVPANARAKNLMARDEFQKETTRLNRWRPLCCLAGGAVAFAWLIAVLLLARWTGRGDFNDSLDPLMGGLAFLAVVIQLAVVIWSSRRLDRCLVCPECDKPLNMNHIVQATGCCTNCGIQVLTEPNQPH